MPALLIAVLMSAAAPPGVDPPALEPSRDAAVPTISWPVRRSYHRLFRDPVFILQPRFPDLCNTRRQILVVDTANGLEVASARTGRALWRRPRPCRMQPLLLGLTASRYLFATPHRLFALTQAEGRLAWEFGKPAPDDPGKDPESLVTWTVHAITARSLYAASNHGDLLCIDCDDGTLRWRHETGMPPPGHLVADRKRVAAIHRRGQDNTLVIRAADTGRLLHTSRLANPGLAPPETPSAPSPDSPSRHDGPPVLALRAIDASTLLVVFSKTLIAIDATSGNARWRIDTRRRFVLATLQTTKTGLFISDDGLCITRYSLSDGRPRWTSPPIGTRALAGLWTSVSSGTLFAASDDAMMAFDASTGGLLWRAQTPTGLRAQPPILTTDSIVTVAPIERRPISDIRTGTRYRISRFDRKTGTKRPVLDGEDLISEPLMTFRGLILHDEALILLDGDALIGYVGTEPTREPHPTQR